MYYLNLSYIHDRYLQLWTRRILEIAMPILNPPTLSGMPANIAGILPLSALIDFTDAERTLHSYQLSGRGLIWNWVITPACARLLISTDSTRVCCLDQSGAVSILHCMDGRWGDAYPCSIPSTVRTCMEVAIYRKFELSDGSVPGGGGDRPQHLRIIRVSVTQTKGSGTIFGDRIIKLGSNWFIVSVSGWVVFLATLVAAVLAGLYIAASYLIVLLLTGVVVRFSHGHRARRITKQEPSPYRRLVVATDNLNGDEWTAFIGPSWLVNPLLNKPLYQIDPPTQLAQFWLLLVLRILIVLQWGLTVVACGYQDWNAFVVFAWIALCAWISSVYGEHASVKSWLRSNALQLERAEVVLSCRRSMLSLLVALNPDVGETSTQWINPILAPSKNRTEWEVALKGCLEKEGWEKRIQACLVCGTYYLVHPCCQ